MALYEVVREGESVLRDKAKIVPKITANVIKLLENMADTMYANKGVGLAAPQIGISKRVIVVDTGNGLIELINPEIMEREGSQTGLEGCLSVPQVFGEVTRALKVVVKGMNRDGKTVEVKAKGYTARALQHEIDHLEGILFIDKATNLRKEENA